MLQSNDRYFKHGRVCIEIAHEKRKAQKQVGGEQAVTLSSFGFVSCGNGNLVEAEKAGTSPSKQTAVMAIPPPPHMI